MTEHYWGLPTLATFIRWLEELIAILSKPFLMLGFIISTLDLLTQGRLLDIWLIYYGWAAIQAIAVDATFFVVWHKVKKAFTAGHWFQFLGYVFLGVALGIVAWAAMDLQSLEQAVGISNAEALARLNLNPVLLTHLRSLVAVIMGAIVAMISPEESKSVDSKKGKKWSMHVKTKAIKWGIKIPFLQVVSSSQNAEKTDKVTTVLPFPVGTTLVEEADKNVPHSEYFAWPISPEQAAEYQQDFTLIEHTKPEEIEPVFSESKKLESTSNEEEQKPQSDKETSRRTMTIGEVIQATGLTEKKVKNLIAKKTFKVSSRNANLILISSFDEWIKVSPNSKETMEIPVVQLAGNHRNGGENNGTQNHL